jgi:hypothetical protein
MLCGAGCPNLRPIVNRPALWGSQSWLQPAFSRLSSSHDSPVSAARDAPEGIVRRSCERASVPRQHESRRVSTRHARERRRPRAPTSKRKGNKVILGARIRADPGCPTWRRRNSGGRATSVFPAASHPQSGSANATNPLPVALLRPLPPKAAITTYCRPFTSYVAGVAFPEFIMVVSHKSLPVSLSKARNFRS